MAVEQGTTTRLGKTSLREELLQILKRTLTQLIKEGASGEKRTNSR